MKKCMRIILSFALCTVISANCLTGCTFGNSKGNTTEKECVISNSNGEYYIKASQIVKLESDGSVTAVKYSGGSEEDTGQITIFDEKSVYVDDVIYAQQDDITSELFKFEFTDNPAEMERSIWVSEDTLLNSDVVINDNYGYSGNMRYWNADGDNIYFLCIPTPDYFQSEKSIAYRLGKISMDGKSIEFIGNETASAYAVKDNWIYFYDNGYTYQTNNFSIDYERAGIYKMKGDGSEKTLLLGGFEPDSERQYNDLCDKMNIYGDYLYFLDYSAKGQSRVSRIKLDGSEYENVSNHGAYDYTIDMGSDNMYYATGEEGRSRVDDRTIYQACLKDNTEKELFKYGSIGEPIISFYKGYLYFKNSGSFSTAVRNGKNKEISNVSGMRYKIDEGKMERLYGYYEIEKTMDGIFEKQTKNGPYFYWEDYAGVSDRY